VSLDLLTLTWEVIMNNPGATDRARAELKRDPSRVMRGKGTPQAPDPDRSAAPARPGGRDPNDRAGVDT
jgi:hypothetical protein